MLWNQVAVERRTPLPLESKEWCRLEFRATRPGCRYAMRAALQMVNGNFFEDENKAQQQSDCCARELRNINFEDAPLRVDLPR